jgi:hypothetical protein
VSEPELTVEARAATLAAELAAIRLREQIREPLGDGERIDEVLWLRRVVARQASEIARLQDRIHELEQERLGLGLEELVRALAAAVETGEAALEGRVIGGVRADLKARLDIDGNAGVTLRDPQDLAGAALSTISVDLRRVPPIPAEEARRAAAGEVLTAAALLQAALDREWSEREAGLATRALGSASVLAAAAPRPDDVPALARSLETAVRPLAAQVPVLESSAAALTAVATSLPDRPAAEELSRLAEAVRAAADAIAGPEV